MQKLPADPTSLVLGIIAIVVSITGCCCSWLFIIPMALSIIGLVMANNSLKEFHLNPEAYSPASKSNVNIGKVLNIIGLVISILFFLFLLVRLIFFGSLMSTSVWDEIQKNNSSFEDFEYDENEWDYEEDKDSIEQQSDTLVIDKIEIEEIEETTIPEN